MSEYVSLQLKVSEKEDLIKVIAKEIAENPEEKDKNIEELLQNLKEKKVV